ncbi:RluA family pseudouridine synthase [Paenibacillus sp. sgz302251]|uniref:RluA family pseudouridine synthase n=1 Tax=Paenibacillus sp. sgz302251 TaxID=3414493 RepID=UPI003C7BD896
MINKGQAQRNGQWLELDWTALEDPSISDKNQSFKHINPAELPELAQPRAGSHPHSVRQWLLARSLFPPKWINRLFSIGGMRWNGDKLQLLAFSPVEPQSDSLYRKALLPKVTEAPDVLYEDDFCIVFHKPAGMPVHESVPGQRGTLDEAAARHMLKQDDPLTVRHIHRLDDDTSGPVLYAKNDLAQWQLDEAMRRKAIDRHYIAVVQGRVSKAAATISLPIGKDRHHRARRRVTEGGEQAVTHYEVVESSAKATIVRVKLETGRTHQIRVHMSHIGHPLVGDTLYGGDTRLLSHQALHGERLLSHQALHGERLLFPHPWTEVIVDTAAPWPKWLEQLSENMRSRSK